MAMTLLTIEEAATRARISPSLLRQQIAEARGPAVTRLGHGRSRPMIREDCLEEWIKARTEPVSASAAE